MLFLKRKIQGKNNERKVNRIEKELSVTFMSFFFFFFFQEKNIKEKI